MITRNKYIELDIPDVTEETQFFVFLRVQNHVGSTDTDTLLITVEAPIVDSYTAAFSDAMQVQEDITSFTVVDEAAEYREPLTETVINADYLTIQALNKDRLNPMEVSIVNAFIFDFLKERGVKNILDPNRKIPDQIQVNKLKNAFGLVLHIRGLKLAVDYICYLGWMRDGPTWFGFFV